MTVSDLRAARAGGRKLAMLTCYDYTTARLMQQAGVPMLLVGDSAASVILGHETTLPVPLDFMIQITAAVRRGAPLAMVMADMPFGSYQVSVAQGMRNVLRMIKRSGCDAVKLEVAPRHLRLVRRLADAGVAVVAHLGLRPQAVGALGGYKASGRTAADAEQIVNLAAAAQEAGTAAILLEAVPAEVSEAVVETTELPVIGCGAGPACQAHVVVTHDALGLTERRPKFVPHLADAAQVLLDACQQYQEQIGSGKYPGPAHIYDMPADERRRFQELVSRRRAERERFGAVMKGASLT